MVDALAGKCLAEDYVDSRRREKSRSLLRSGITGMLYGVSGLSSASESPCRLAPYRPILLASLPLMIFLPEHWQMVSDPQSTDMEGFTDVAHCFSSSIAI